MAQFTMKIAGCVAGVTSLFESTPAYFRNYLTEEAPQVQFSVTQDDLAFEKDFLYREALEEGFRVRNFPDPFLERAAIQRKFAEYLFDADVLLLHGSTVALDGQAYLFTAKCGTGKSTHTRLWREVFGSRAVMVNDDKPFLRIRPEGVLASGSPWSGKHGLDSNITVPLAGICILERGPENRIRPMAPAEALPMLLWQSCPPLAPEKQPAFTSLVETLAHTAPLWHMECTKNPDAARLAWETMHKKT